MENLLFYSAGSTAACHYAREKLKAAGFPFIQHISPEITHLLLDVPSFGPDGSLRGGGDLVELLRMLPAKTTVVGGNLSHDELDGYTCMDLLRDPEYLALNAYITAECALQTAASLMPTIFRGTPVLVAGWGRIGKCLASLLQALGAEVTVAVRKETDRAMIRALGYKASVIGIPAVGYRLIFNTVPEMILPEEALMWCKTCIKIDLASRRGIEGNDVVWARGLPGVLAPESSGALIADTIVRRIKEEMI